MTKPLHPLPEKAVDVLAEPRIRLELEGMRHLMEDEPSPEGIGWQAPRANEPLHVRLHEIQPPCGYRFAPQNGNIVLSQHPPRKEPQRHSNLDGRRRPTGVGPGESRQPAHWLLGCRPRLLERFQDLRKAFEIRIDPVDPIERVHTPRSLGNRRIHESRHNWD